MAHRLGRARPVDAPLSGYPTYVLQVDDLNDARATLLVAAKCLRSIEQWAEDTGVVDGPAIPPGDLMEIAENVLRRLVEMAQEQGDGSTLVVNPP